MPGGLYVLVAYGAQDTYLTGGNPEINHFRYVARTHIHHAKEPINIHPEGFNGPPDRNRVLEMRFPIVRVGDLLHSANLLYTLPAIRVPDPYEDVSGFSQVRWVRHPGISLIEEMRMIVGGTEVQVMDRERLYTLIQTDLLDDERDMYNQMAGDVPGLVDPGNGPLKRTTAIDPSGYDSTYPYARLGDLYSLPETRLRIPTMFWFTRCIRESLPIGFLTRHECEMIVRLRPWSKMIQVRNTDQEEWMPPPADFDFSKYFSSWSNSAWEPNPVLEGVYYFLNDTARETMARTEIKVPVFQLHRYNETTAQTRGYFAASVENQTSSNVQLSSVSFRVRQEANPVTRMFIMARREDFFNKNHWSRFGNWEDPTIGRTISDTLIPYEDPIIQSMTLQFNGNEVLEDIPRDYLTMFDPFRHSMGSGNNGIACYSFGITNEPDKTSGTANFGRVRDPIITVQLTPASIAPDGYMVSLLVESVNWFKYTAGYAGLEYAT